jgi:low affinity Fe/Cu permease
VRRGGPRLRRWFSRFAAAAARWTGSATAFVLAAGFVVAWVIGGLWWTWTDPTYALILNSVTTVVTFLMVFLIQHEGDRDTRAVQLKLDEIVRAQPGARNEVAGIERQEG